MLNKLAVKLEVSMSNIDKISKANNVKKVEFIYDDIAKGLAEIDALQYIKIYNERIKASNLMSTNGKKEPIVNGDESSIIGVELLIDIPNETIQFFYISSAVKGYGEKIVSSVLKATPEEWSVVVLLDWSHGFWPVMADRYPRLILV